MNKKILSIFTCLIFGVLIQCFGQNQTKVDSLNFIFKKGTEGYASFRIPAVITTNKGTILLFAEGRKKGASDSGDIDLVMKSSSDQGKTWTKLKVIRDDADNVCGNPAPVVDRSTGMIYLLSTWNLGADNEKSIINQSSKDKRRVYILSSSDNGENWSEAKEITASVKPDTWTWYATGPCHGIQVENGVAKGRLIIPCDHIESGTNKYFSHIIYSDDHGKTWKIGGTTPQDQVNESTVAELSNGTLMLNMRNYDRTLKSRKVSLSSDGGMTWGNIYPDTTLIESICQGSLFSVAPKRKGKSQLLFINPADQNSRKNITLRLSLDDGKSWIKSISLYSGPSAYSDITRLKDGSIGCFYEAGFKSAYEGIVFQKVSLTDL
jgi:sialidase-1